jgi:hypothetical protein
MKMQNSQNGYFIPFWDGGYSLGLTLGPALRQPMQAAPHGSIKEE